MENYGKEETECGGDNSIEEEERGTHQNTCAIKIHHVVLEDSERASGSIETTGIV